MNKDEAFNWILQIVFDLWVIFNLGPKGFFYIMFGSFFGMGIHPMTGHFISEYFNFLNFLMKTVHATAAGCYLMASLRRSGSRSAALRRCSNGHLVFTRSRPSLLAYSGDEVSSHAPCCPTS